MTEQANLHQQIIAKCWADDAFKQRLLADPAGTLKQDTCSRANWTPQRARGRVG